MNVYRGTPVEALNNHAVIIPVAAPVPNPGAAVQPENRVLIIVTGIIVVTVLIAVTLTVPLTLWILAQNSVVTVAVDTQLGQFDLSYPLQTLFG